VGTGSTKLSKMLPKMLTAEQISIQTAEHWSALSIEELLKMRICDFKLKLEDSSLKLWVDDFFEELKIKELPLKPKLYLGDEWFSPEGVVAIAIPFFLAHPRLIEIEKQFMLEAEGDARDYFLRLLRHEAGHCFEHAFRFSGRKKWQDIFGSPNAEYHPETYRPRPYSKSFVKNLKNWYAQSHPDEDFSETFAVWLDPNSDWRNVYQDWPLAYKKLDYIDQLVIEARTKKGKIYGGEYLISNANKLTSTLETYYKKKRREQAADYPDFYDGDLKKIFLVPSDKDHKKLPKAYAFMRRHRRMILENVNTWTGEHIYVIETLIKKLTARCHDLDLRVHLDETNSLVKVSTYLCTLVSNYLFTGKFRRKI